MENPVEKAWARGQKKNVCRNYTSMQGTILVHIGNVTAKFRSFSKKNATTTFVLVFYSGEVIAAMAVDIPPWAVEAGRKDVKGDHCLVAWPKVCLPKELGGLGISNIQNLCWALRIYKRVNLVVHGECFSFRFIKMFRLSSRWQWHLKLEMVPAPSSGLISGSMVRG